MTIKRARNNTSDKNMTDNSHDILLAARENAVNARATAAEAVSQMCAGRRPPITHTSARKDVGKDKKLALP